MKETHIKWQSPILGKEMDMLVFGTEGYPVVIFPTSMGSYSQNKDFHLVDAVSWYVNNGYIKVYTPASIDHDSWYNTHIPAAARAYNHTLYDSFVMNEVVKPALKETGHEKAAFAGCSFGAYHALNFGTRHPEVTGYIISMGGAFDISDRVKGYYDDNVYFNNPPDFLPGLEDEGLKDIGFIFGTGTRDMCMDANVRMSEILNNKNIPNHLEVIEGGIHDWPVWREMFPKYLAMLLNKEAEVSHQNK